MDKKKLCKIQMMDYGLSNQVCNCCSDMQSTVANGFYNSEIAANNRQMANMQTSFDLSRQFADCCCENRLGIANLNSTILSENCADRAALADGLKDVLINQTANTQRILDQLCNDKINFAHYITHPTKIELDRNSTETLGDLGINQDITVNAIVAE